jgi:hypothetical protein
MNAMQQGIPRIEELDGWRSVIYVAGHPISGTIQSAAEIIGATYY